MDAWLNIRVFMQGYNTHGSNKLASLTLNALVLTIIFVAFVHGVEPQHNAVW